MPNINYIKDERINPQTGTPDYYNLNKDQSAPIDWGAYRKSTAVNEPIISPVGLEFEPHGGIKSADEGMSAASLYDIPEARAEQQWGIELFGKAMGQAVNEATLGTLEGAGYLADLQGIKNSIQGTETEFDNWWSNVFRGLKEKVNEDLLPIYQTHAAQNGDLFDRTALAGGLKNVATSLSLMIPALGVARGINIAGKLAGMGRNALVVSEAIGAGIASRAAENTMEAQQYLAQNNERNKLDLSKKYEAKAMEEINRLPLILPKDENGVSAYSQEQRLADEKRIIDKYKAHIDSEAKQMAIEGANKVFKADGAMVIVDAFQYMPIFRGFGETFKAVKGGAALSYGLNMASESAEEIYQSGVQAEAYGSMKAGVDMLGAGFSERMGEYFTSNEMKQSAFWGAAGAGMFNAMGPLAKKAVDAYVDIEMWKTKAARSGNVEAFQKLTDLAKEDIIYKHAKRGRLDRLSQEFDSLEGTLNEQNWDELGISKEEAGANIKSMKEDIAFAQKELALLDNDTRFNGKEEVKLDFLKNKMTARNNGKLIASIDKSITSLYKDIETSNELSPELLRIKKVQDKLNAVKAIRENLKSIPSLRRNRELRKTVEAEMKQKQLIATTKLEELQEAYLQANPGADFNSLLTTAVDSQLADKHFKLNELNTVQEKVIKPTLKAYEDFGKIEQKEKELKEKRAKEQKAEVKKQAKEASTPEQIDAIAEASPEEVIPEVVTAVEKTAMEEEIEAPADPYKRYKGRPNLFTQEMNSLEGAVLAEFSGQLDPTTDAELGMLLLSKNSDEFEKNLKMLENLSFTSPAHHRLYDTIKKFYASKEEVKEEHVQNTTVPTHSESEVVVHEKTEEEPEASVITEEEPVANIAEFYPTASITSDIGYTPMDEKASSGFAPYRANVRQFTLTKGDIKRVNGVPEIDFVGKTMPIDWDYVNDPDTLATGSEVYFIVNLDATIGSAKDAYHQKLTGQDFIGKSQILIAQKGKDGKEHIVNALPIYSDTDNSEGNAKLKALRTEIWEGVRASKQKTGMHNTGISSKITKKYSGRLIVTKAQNAPHEVLGKSEKLVLGIAVNINGQVTIMPGKNLGAEYQGIVVNEKNVGGVFMLIRGANGRIVPARCFTQRLSKFPKLLKEAKDLLLNTNKDNWAVNREQLRKITYLDYNYIAATDSFELRGAKGAVTTFTKEDLDKILKDKIVQINSSEINRGDYNQRISAEGRLKTDLNPVKNIGNANFEFSLDTHKTGESPKVEINKPIITTLPEEYDTDRLSTDPIFGIPDGTKEVEKELDEVAEPKAEFNSGSLNDLEEFDNPLGTVKFRTLTPSETYTEFYEKWDEAKETAWFKERFDESLINTEEFRQSMINIANSGGRQAWGMFSNGVAYIAGAAKVGTTYHEAFHLVFNLFLNQNQQAQILKEGAVKFGIDINDKLAIEEALAERFMEYVQTQESQGLGKKILEFFKHLYYAIKSNITSDLTINQLFDKTQNKGFKTAKFERNVDSFKVTRYSEKIFTSYETIRRAVALADVMRLSLDKQIANNPDWATLSRRDVLERLTLKNKKGTTLKGLELIALSAKASIIEKYKDEVTYNDEQRSGVYKMLEHFIATNEDGSVVFKMLGQKALLQFAKTEGLRIKISTKEIYASVDSAEGQPLLEFAEEETMAEGWQIKTENLSGKESLSNEVRKELSYIPKLGKDGDPMKDDLGFIIYQDFNTVYADLQRDLSNIIDSEEMADRLQDIAAVKPYLNGLYEKVMSDNLFRTKMFVNFNKSHVDYKIVNEFFVEQEATEADQYGQPVRKTIKRRQFNIISSNRNGIKNLLVDEWKDNSTVPEYNKLLNADGTFNPVEMERVKKAWAAVSARMKTKSVYNEKDLSDLSKILNYTGITITLDDLILLNKDVVKSDYYTDFGSKKVNEFKLDADKLINSYTLGKNPFESGNQESEAIDSVAKAISKFRFELMESSFKNAENNTVFAHQVPTFLSRFINQFKGRNAQSILDWYTSTPFYRNSPWLKELQEMESRVNFNFIEIDAIKYKNSSKGVRYTAMSERDFENTAVNMYFNNNSKNYVYYKFPVVSDAPKMPFIEFRRYDVKEVTNKLYEVYKQELARIEQVKARKVAREELVKNGQPIPDELRPIKHFDTDKSQRFLFLTFLNQGHARKVVGSGNEAAIKQEITNWMNQEAVKDYERLVKLGVLGKDAKNNPVYDSRIDSRWGNDKAFHNDYFYNVFLANTQMMSLFSGDPAFYKADKASPSIYSRTVDYQKRNKQNVSPKTNIDVNAVYTLTENQSGVEGKNLIEVSPFYNNIYIKDLEIPSEHAETIFETLIEGGMSEDLAGEIAAAYGYSKTEREASNINVTDAQAYITLPRYREIMIGLGRWTKDLQDLYPRLLEGKASKEELLVVMQPIKPFYFGHSKLGNLILPSQNKNSEYLLLPQLVKGSKELSRIYNHMMANNIGAANFNSAVKAGEYGAESWNNIEKASVHQMNNTDYGLQQETPEHHVDSRSLFGSQLRKIIISDIDPNAVFKIGKYEFSKTELVKLYQDLINEDLSQDFDRVNNKFDNIDSIHELLIAEILDRDLGEEREKAIEIIERVDRKTGEKKRTFKLDLWHPFHAKSNESLMNSVFKNNVTKQKIKGGAFVQVSSFGFTDKLNLLMDGEKLLGAEVMLPWWSRKFFEPMLDKDGQLDINKVPQNLREMIGYRIPTEDKYSMLPLIVKGFLPASAGGAVMLPMEITTISGSDFDIDKMYIMMPEFEKVGNDIVKVKYDYSNKNVGKQNKQARNNAKIDIIRAILTHQDTFSKVIKPGGFPTLSKLAEKILKLEGKADEMLPMALPSTQTELFKRNMTGKQLIGIFANHNTNHTVLQFGKVGFKSPVVLNGKMFHNLSHIKNVEGEFISRNVAEWLAAVVDNAKNPLSSFINVNTYTADVAAMLTRLGFPLETVVAFLSQPILKEFSNEYFKEGADKQSEFKAIEHIEKLFGKGWSSSLSLKKDESFDQQNQRLTDEKTGYLKNEELFEAIEKKELVNQTQYDVFKSFLQIKEQATALADLVRALRADTKGAGPTLSENEKMVDTVEQVMASSSMTGQHEMMYGNIIGPLVNGDREDFTNNDAINRSLLAHFPIGATLVYTERNEDGSLAEEKTSTITGYSGVDNFKGFKTENGSEYILPLDVKSVNGQSLESLILLDHPYPINYSFYANGVKKPTEMLSKYFPWFSSAFRTVKNHISKSTGNGTLSVKQIEQINYELLGYAASGFEFFNGSDRAQIVNNMAKRVRAFRTKFPKEAAENFFINKLVFKKDEKNQFLPERVQFKNTGSLTEQDRQQIKEAWTELLESPKFANFAKELIKYAFYSSGFQLTPNSFSHLIPVDFYDTLTDSNGLLFNDYLDSMIDEAQSNVIYLPFVDQFFRNNWDDMTYVPAVDNEEFANITGGVNYINGKPSWFEVNAQDKKTRKDFVIGATRLESIGKTSFEFVPFVSLREKGQTYLFKLTNDGFDTATYVLTGKLGVPNATLEYDRNNEEFESVITLNSPYTKIFTLEKILESIEKRGEKPSEVKKEVLVNMAGKSIVPKLKAKMTFNYGQNKRPDITSATTFEAIKNGERTATTRYESDGHIDYWKQAKEGDIIEFESSTGAKVLVEVTKPLSLLVPSADLAETWSRKEGWSVEYFNSKVIPKINEAWQIEYKILGSTPKQTAQNVSVTNAVVNQKGFINHSGGAEQADVTWGKIGEKYGVVSNHYWMTEKTPHGNTEITKADEIEGQQKVTTAARQMGRIEPTHQIRNTKLIRNWSQVKYADAIFAISTLLKTGDKMNYDKPAKIVQVKGGTGYAVQMAINEGKPVYVFDQARNQWYSHIDGKWAKSEVPTLTKNFAGIGTSSSLKANGIKAIEDVYKKTFSASPSVTPVSAKPESKEALPDHIQLWAEHHTAIDKKYPDMTINDFSHMSGDEIKKLLECL
jgi:hypothetical protein